MASLRRALKGVKDAVCTLISTSDRVRRMRSEHAPDMWSLGGAPPTMQYPHAAGRIAEEECTSDPGVSRWAPAKPRP